MANEIKDLIDYMKSDAAERRKAEKEAIEKDRQQLETLRQGFESQGQNADDIRNLEVLILHYKEEN